MSSETYKAGRIAQLEHDRDALLEDYASRSLEALHSLTSEQRDHLHKMLRLRLIANEGGTAALDADALPSMDCSKVGNL